MKDKLERIIYVGKAKNLKKRLSSYFIKESGHDQKTTLLIKNIADFEVIITATENEALILEATLIKKHKPKYNIFLKDGKNYPCFRIDILQDYPVLQIVRKIKDDGAAYFGPYASGHSVKQVLNQVNRIFQLRKCRDNNFKNRTRPCIQFQIKACLGPCCNDVPLQTYSKIVSDVTLFLKGRTPDLIKKLKQEMMSEAEKEQFEKAAKIRDTIFAIEKSLEQQIAVSTDMMDRDVVASAVDSGRAIVTIIFVRSGYVVGTEHHSFDVNLSAFDKEWSVSAQVMEAFLKQYYQAYTNQNLQNNEKSLVYSRTIIPTQILISEDFEDKAILEEILSEAKGKKVNILVPEKGEKRRIIEMAINNASLELKASISKSSENNEILTTLQKLLGMKKYPARIECFDNSNIAGTDPVSSMVVFINGEPAKSSYRRFIIKNVKEHDDYAYMTEVLSRRFASYKKSVLDNNNVLDNKNAANNKSKNRGSESKSVENIELPDLIVVDGGKGQLSMAVAVLEELEFREIKPKNTEPTGFVAIAESQSTNSNSPVSESELELELELELTEADLEQSELQKSFMRLSEVIKIIGLAKKDEEKGETHDKVYVHGRANPLNMTQSPQATKALYLLQRLRDEAHRFAITFQRKRRAKRSISSFLDGIDGIGKKRKEILLKHFKGVNGIKKATVEEIASIPGMSISSAKALVKAMAD